MLFKTINLNARPTNGIKPIANVLSNHLFYYPTPSNLTYAWSFGSLVGLFFALQLITGILLAMHYTPHVDYAFSSVEHIMEDVTGGYLLRYFHANGASAIFILIYLHIARNLYYQSYLTRPVLWQSGLVIFLLMMATAFIGYVLPWGQMSFWGATVITSLVTAVPYVGQDIAHWVWGGFSINNATLTRFFSLHYLLPFLITGLIGGHLILLHTSGSSDPLTLQATPDKITFHPYFTYKDTFILTASAVGFSILVAYLPNLLGHSDNFLPANPLVTPAHIVPEWYFTPFYAILRACPNKLGGAIGMFAAIIMLFFLPYYLDAREKYLHVFAPYATMHKLGFWFFVVVFLTLMFLGSRAAAAPYVVASKIFTVAYFFYFLVLIPFFAVLGQAMLDDINEENNLKHEHHTTTPLRSWLEFPIWLIFWEFEVPAFYPWGAWCETLCWYAILPAFIGFIVSNIWDITNFGKRSGLWVLKWREYHYNRRSYRERNGRVSPYAPQEFLWDFWYPRLRRSYAITHVMFAIWRWNREVAYYRTLISRPTGVFWTGLTVTPEMRDRAKEYADLRASGHDFNPQPIKPVETTPELPEYDDETLDDSSK